MATHKRRKLRNLLTNRGFQGRVVVIVLFFGCLSFVLNGLLFYFFVQKNYAIIFGAVDVPPVLVQSLLRDLREFGLTLLVLSLLATLVIAFYLLVLTHRAAGAAYHLHRVIEEISAGNADARVHLRRKDEFQDLAKAFNAMVDGLQQERRDPVGSAGPEAKPEQAPQLNADSESTSPDRPTASAAC